MTIDINDILTLTTATLIGWSCALLGVFLVLKKIAMVGDAISHSVLPGIVIAYLFAGGFSEILGLVGAAVFGVLTTLIIEFLHQKLKLQEDASIGITFTWLFALGVIFIVVFTGGNADIDQDCVLFGELGLTFLDKVYIGGRLWGTRSIWMIFPVFILVVLYILFGFKSLKILSFDASFAKSLGLNTRWMYLTFMSLVAITTVMSFESVGAVLVIGMLTIPASAAYVLSNDIRKMIFLSLIISSLSVFIGYYLAFQWDVTIGSTIVVVMTAFLLLALSFNYMRRKMSFVRRDDGNILKKTSHKKT